MSSPVKQVPGWGEDSGLRSRPQRIGPSPRKQIQAALHRYTNPNENAVGLNTETQMGCGEVAPGSSYTASSNKNEIGGLGW